MAAIFEWFRWLKEHGERVLETESEGDVEGEIEVAETLRVDSNPVESGKPESLFRSQVPPIDEDDIK